MPLSIFKSGGKCADTRDALESGNRALAARAVQQFVAKIVVKKERERFITRSRLKMICICQ